MKIQTVKAKFQNAGSWVKNATLGGSVALMTVVSAPSFANTGSTAPDFTTLTSGIDFSSVVTAIMAVALALVGVYLAIRGAKIVLQMLRGA